MRIVHCAPFNIFTKTGGALYSNPVKISLGLIQNGHFVHNFDYRDTARYLSLFRSKKNGKDKMNTFFLSVIDDIKPDLVILGHAELINIDVLEKIKTKNITTVFWYNDVPISEKFLQLSPYIDYALAMTGGKFIEDMKKYVKNSFFIPNIVDINCEKYQSFNNTNYINDLLFVSRLDQDRQRLYNFLYASLGKKIKLSCFGQNKNNIVLGDNYFKQIYNSKITLNPNREFTLSYDWYTSDRLMHILGNGGFALTTPMIDSERFFEDKLQSYKSFEDLEEKVNYFLKEDEKRRDISKWLYNKTHELFNAKRVTKYFLDIISERDLKGYEWYK